MCKNSKTYHEADSDTLVRIRTDAHHIALYGVDVVVERAVGATDDAESVLFNVSATNV